MKKLFTLFMAAASFVACTRTSYKEQIEMPGEFTANIENIDTKTSMDGLRVLWSSGDQVSVFSGMNINEQYQVSKSSAGKSSASFSKVSGSDGYGSAIPANVGYYPFSSDVEVSWESGEAVVYSSIPSVQAYSPDSFGQGSFPMMAVTANTADKDFAFKNVCGVLKLQLTGAQKVERIVFQGNDDEVISGDAVITSSYAGTPSIQMTGNGKTVTLDCGAGVQLSSTPTDFCIALPPMTFSKGFTVTVTDTDGKTMEIGTDRSQTIVRSEILKMPAKEYVCESAVDEPAGELCFTAVEASTISFVHSASARKVKLEYLLEDSKWSPYVLGETIELEVGESVYFRAIEGGNITFSKDIDNFYYFNMTGKVDASGNVMSLLDPTMELDVVPDFAFNSLFQQCNALLTAPELPAHTVGESSYESMFTHCTNLVTAPELPATVLGPECYCFMFSHCTSLTSSPELKAMNLAEGCYSSMFQHCYVLKEAPELPAKVLAQGCYHQMFLECSRLQSAPALPATVLAKSCYENMFWQCVNLTEVPQLPATELKERCYLAMFHGCESLKGVSELPAMTLAVECYSSMFSDCTSLTQAPALPATVLASNCYDSMFLGCTSLTGVPELPAKTLARYCYSSMFDSCTSLTKSPELPATTLKTSCYAYMFADCKSLNEVKCYATDINATEATEGWLDGVASTGTFYADPATNWSRGESGIPEGWIVNTLGGTNNGHDYVDLGLSVKWATVNVGATKPEEYGDYFAWGATEPWYQSGYAQEDPQKHWKNGYSDGYTLKNTPYQTVNTTNFNSTRWTKYVGRTTSSFKDASATDEDALKTVLDPEDDAAHVNWGETWRLPTLAEWTELLDECTWTWTSVGGVSGYKVQSNKPGYADRWIFLPAAGQRLYGGLDNLGTKGYYSSSSMDNNPLLVFLVEFNLNTLYRSSDNRNYGRSVRPVTE